MRFSPNLSSTISTNIIDNSIDSQSFLSQSQIPDELLVERVVEYMNKYNKQNESPVSKANPDVISAIESVKEFQSNVFKTIVAQGYTEPNLASRGFISNYFPQPYPQAVSQALLSSLFHPLSTLNQENVDYKNLSNFTSKNQAEQGTELHTKNDYRPTVVDPKDILEDIATNSAKKAKKLLGIGKAHMESKQYELALYTLEMAKALVADLPTYGLLLAEITSQLTYCTGLAMA
ncbi:MAG: hypothetical protein K0S74_1034 [Chlamydiales bacterium]|jgi:hypothetical protein|nr:hypothetical protein [Chlamydiales bacterium]